MTVQSGGRRFGAALTALLLAIGLTTGFEVADTTSANAASNPAFSMFDIPGSPYAPGSPVVALTFDDGPSPQITPGMLDTLARYGATATFFVVGSYVNAHPELVRRAIALGNSVQLHTMSHADLTKLSSAQIAGEVDPEIQLLTDVTGHRPTCLRPPYGAWNGNVVNEVSARGVETVIWNVNPGDTEAGSNSSSIASRALAGARPGAVLAMHDSATKGATLGALPMILDGLRARGLTPATICGGGAGGWGVPVRDVAVRADGRSGYSLDLNGTLHPFGGAPDIAGATAVPGLARRLVLRADGISGYVLDGWGGIHPFGGAPDRVGTAYWPGWDIARGLSLRPDGRSGWVLDAFGGLHPWGGAPATSQDAYWPGWDIGRAVVATPDGGGGYVLDGFGGLHPFGSATVIRNARYFPGQDIARGVALGFDGHSGWVLDGTGGLSAFGNAPPARSVGRWFGDVARGVGVGADGITGVVAEAGGSGAPFVGAPATRAVALRADATSGYTLNAWGGIRRFGGAPLLGGAPSWPAWDIARDLVMRPDGTSGYLLDGLGSMHPLNGAPAIAGGPRFSNDLARAVALRSDGTSGYVLDAYGALHAFGGAARVTSAGYWPGWDITRGIALRPDGISGYVLDGYGGLHPFGGAPSIVGATGYWPGWDIARGVVLRADGISGWVLDGWGATHPFGGAPVLANSAVYPGHSVTSDIAGVSGTDRVATVDVYGAVTTW